MLMAGLDGVLNKIDPGEPLDKDIYDLSPEEMKAVPSMPASLEEALNALEDDHGFLLKGDVFSEELLETYIGYKRKNEADAVRLRPHPYEFALVLRHLARNRPSGCSGLPFVARKGRPRRACITIRAVPASILQINISKGGVPKRPVPEAVVTPLGIDGDLHAHPEIHGGPIKALLLITSEGIEELKNLGFPLFHGALGENLTTCGLDRRTLRIGQRWRIGRGCDRADKDSHALPDH